MNVAASKALSAIAKIPGAQIKEGAKRTVAHFQTKGGKNIEAVFDKAGELIKRVVKNADGDVLTTMVKKNLGKSAGKNPMHQFIKIATTKDGHGKILNTLKTFADKKGFLLTKYDNGKIASFVKTFKPDDVGTVISDTKIVDWAKRAIETVKLKHFKPSIKKVNTYVKDLYDRHSKGSQAIWAFDNWNDPHKDTFMEFVKKVLPKSFFKTESARPMRGGIYDKQILEFIRNKPFKTGIERMALFHADPLWGKGKF